MREVFFLIDSDQNILWSDASNSPVALPDSRPRWEEIWSRRAAIVEIAHSHPVGPLAFSEEDRTTMEALASALAKPLVFSVIAPNGMVRCSTPDFAAQKVESEPWWSVLLRMASGMEK